jgi:TonB family protein
MTNLILLLLSLAQAGTINGRLLRADGNPAVGMRIAAVEASDRVSMMSVTQTDSAGRYRLEGVPPGRYYIQAGPLGASSYLPGTPDLAKAMVVVVTGSAPVVARDFSFTQWSNILKTTRMPGAGDMAHFSGRLRAASGVSFLQNVVVVLANAQSKARFMTSTDKDGAFEFSDLPAAQYSVEFFSPTNSGYRGGGYEGFPSSIVLNRGESLFEDIQLRMVMSAAIVRERPDWYAPPPPRVAGVSMGESMAFATQKIVEYGPPVYPESARQADLRGVVSLEVCIGKDGSLLWTRIRSLSAEPVLAQAAVDAVNRWRFQAFRRNDEFVESRTTVTFNFPPE